MNTRIRGKRADTGGLMSQTMKTYDRITSEVDTSMGTVHMQIKRKELLDVTPIIFTEKTGNFHVKHDLVDR